MSNGVGSEFSSAKTHVLPYSIVLRRLRSVWQVGGGGVAKEGDHVRQLLRLSVVDVMFATSI
jgi:hypothetical protein